MNKHEISRNFPKNHEISRNFVNNHEISRNSTKNHEIFTKFRVESGNVMKFHENYHENSDHKKSEKIRITIGKS